VWVFVVIPLLIVALIVLLIWRTRGSEEDSVSPATSTSSGPAATGTTTAVDGTAPGSGTTAGTGTGSTTGTVPGTAPGTGTTPSATATTAAGAPGGTTVVAGPAGPEGPAGPTGPTGSGDGTSTSFRAGTAAGGASDTPGASGTVGQGTGAGSSAAGPRRPAAQGKAESAPPSTPIGRALVLAQEMADALADDDWREVRRLSPTDQRTIGEFERDYAGLESSTVVPVWAASLSSGLVDLRIGLVAHESRPAGPQTSLFCAHWIVDPSDRTIQRLDAARIRTEPGTTPPADVTAELETTCEMIELR
jgi:hypothetical protein